MDCIATCPRYRSARDPKQGNTPAASVAPGWTICGLPGVAGVRSNEVHALITPGLLFIVCAAVGAGVFSKRVL